MRRERAVLAVTAARPRQRQRQISREGDAAGHPSPPYRGAHRSHPRPRWGFSSAAAAAPRAAIGPNEDATLLLDFAPNAVHSGIYLATRAATTRRRASSSRSARPAPRPTRSKLLQTGRADMAILDIHDLGLAREKGRDVVGVMAIVQRPLAAVIAQPGIGAPARPRGPPRRRHRAAVRRRGAALGRRRRRRRPGQGARDDDRLRGGQGAARQARRRRDGVLERRGRRAEATAARLPGVPRRRLRRAVVPRARAVRDPLDARGARAGRCGPRSGRSSAATRRRRPSPTAPSRAVLDADRGRDRAELAAQLDAVSPAFTAGAARVRAAARRTCCARGRRGTWVRDPVEAARRLEGVRPSLVGPGPQPLDSPTSRSTSAAPSRAIRERGTTRSKPAASARRLVSTSTCE